MKSRFKAVLGAVVIAAMAQAASAQGPRHGEFGERGHEGPGGPGMMMGGGRHQCVATATVPCPEYQFTVTITSTQPVLVGGTPKTVTNVTTGTIAQASNGSTYRDMKLSGLGPWTSQGGPEEFIYIRNTDPSVMMNYIVNVTTPPGTYEQFPIRERTGPDGKRPHDGANFPAPPIPTVVDDNSSGYDCKDAQKTTITHAVQLPGETGTTNIVTNRVYCPDLKVVIEEDHTDPRFGTRTYQLSGYMPAPHVSFLPPAGARLVERKGFGPGGRHMDRDKGAPGQP